LEVVASSVGVFARCETSIWSPRFANEEQRFRVMTIKVKPVARTICQTRRRGNAFPNEKALGVMRLWAEQEGLKIGLWREGVFVIN